MLASPPASREPPDDHLGNAEPARAGRLRPAVVGETVTIVAHGYRDRQLYHRPLAVPRRVPAGQRGGPRCRECYADRRSDRPRGRCWGSMTRCAGQDTVAYKAAQQIEQSPPVARLLPGGPAMAGSRDQRAQGALLLGRQAAKLRGLTAEFPPTSSPVLSSAWSTRSSKCRGRCAPVRRWPPRCSTAMGRPPRPWSASLHHGAQHDPTGDEQQDRSAVRTCLAARHPARRGLGRGRSRRQRASPATGPPTTFRRFFCGGPGGRLAASTLLICAADSTSRVLRTSAAATATSAATSPAASSCRLGMG